MLTNEPISIQFRIPATDHLGKNEVEGKIRFLAESVELDWRLKGNVFRGGQQEVETITLDYGEIEHVELKKRWWKLSQIILRISNPASVEAIPGIEMGKMTLEIDARSREEAKNLGALIDFKRSIFLVDQQTRRLEAMSKEL
ncbi:hypothetical protein [Rubritalea profundi]|uniref:Uncharacterized protein n=1 Tax=Rubritalea profundi TaxID=1658618 RepID=A0A2S7U3S5_9BACT|nr:hypothetical protein [Rubritalea profundi]PQJ28803.1 hypothetical protein BSZ32_10065 [Rubritalea profundi]